MIITIGGIKGSCGKALMMAFLTLLLQGEVFAINGYTAIELPKEFVISEIGEQILNNKGQVIGHIGKLGENEKAAYWSLKSGVVKIDLTGRSTTWAINNNGDIVAFRDRSILWETGSNKFKFGPVGHPIAINDSKDILIASRLGENSHGYSIWDTTDNTVTLFTNLPPAIAIEWKPYFNAIAPIKFNKKLNGVRTHSSDIYLIIDGKNKLLIPKDGKVYMYNTKAFINDNDEVIAITYKSNPDIQAKPPHKNIFSLTKWKKDGTSISEALINFPKFKELFEQNLHTERAAKIRGFNNLGQILIVVHGKTFLLTPNKNVIKHSR